LRTARRILPQDNALLLVVSHLRKAVLYPCCVLDAVETDSCGMRRVRIDLRRRYAYAGIEMADHARYARHHQPLRDKGAGEGVRLGRLHHQLEADIWPRMRKLVRIQLVDRHAARNYTLPAVVRLRAGEREAKPIRTIGARRPWWARRSHG